MGTHITTVRVTSLTVGMRLASPHTTFESSDVDASTWLEYGGHRVSAVRFDSDGAVTVQADDLEGTACIWERVYDPTAYVRILVGPSAELVAMGDDPVTCPDCGARTDFTEQTDGRQNHKCLSGYCGREFVTEEEDVTPGDIAHTLIRGALDNGGASHRIGETADHGYLVGLPDHGRVIENAVAMWDDLGPAQTPKVVRWVRDNSPGGRDYSERAATLGSWIDGDTDTLYLDVSAHYANLDDALTAAADLGELAIWDIANERVIRTDGTVSAVDLKAGDTLADGRVVTRVLPIDTHDGDDLTRLVQTTWAGVAGSAATARVAPTARFNLSF